MHDQDKHAIAWSKQAHAGLIFPSWELNMGAGISMCFAVPEKQQHHHHEKEEEELRAKILALEEQIKELKSAGDDHEKWRRRKEEEDDDDDETARPPSSPKIKYLTEEEERLRWLAAAAAATATATARSSSSSERMQRRNELYVWREDESVEQMTEERDEAAEKWKQLYLAMKAELDLLIQRTQRGGRFDWKAEELMMEWHAKELRAQEEMIETFRSRIAVMEKEEAKRDREMDILRQSLKILGTKTKSDLIVRKKKKKKSLLPAGCLLCS